MNDLIGNNTMQNNQPIQRIVDLTDVSKNIIYNMSVEEARNLVKNGNPREVRSIDGQFALVAVNGKTVRLARSISRPLRYFIAKHKDGPCLVAADRMDLIFDFLKSKMVSRGTVFTDFDLGVSTLSVRLNLEIVSS